MNNYSNDIKFNEGQWFLIPLGDDYFSAGFIARHSAAMNGGLGYFFINVYCGLPGAGEITRLYPDQAILIAWFSDAGIVNGKWPLIAGRAPFERADWPVPLFHREDMDDPRMGWMVEYDQETPVFGSPIQQTRSPIVDVMDLPHDTLYSSGALELMLKKMLI